MKHIVARPPKKAVEPWATRTCEECRHGIWDTKFANLDLNGKPTLLSCPFHEWKRIRTDKACKNFIDKTL